MTAEQNNEDLFCEVCKSFSSLSSNSAVSKTVFDMLQVRIETMAAQYNELIRLNYEGMRYSTLRQEVEFDPETSLMTIKINGQIAQQLKLNRANPNVPIEFVNELKDSCVPLSRNETTHVDLVHGQSFG